MDSYGVVGSSHFNLAGVVTPVRQLTVAEVVRILVASVVAISSLRTNFEEAELGWSQIVRSSGSFAVRISQIGDVQLLAHITEEALCELNSEPFNLGRDSPIRFCLIVFRSAVLSVIYSVSHSAVDAYGRRLLHDGLITALGGQPIRTASGPGAFADALEESSFQSSAKGSQIHEEAMAHWKTALRQLPLHMGPPVTESFYDLRLDSPHLLGWAREIADAYNVSPSGVLLAAASWASGRALGESVFCPQVSVSNRFRRAIRNMIAPVAMEGILYIPIRRREPFKQLLARTIAATFRTYRASYFNKRGMLELARRIGDSRGGVVDVTRWYNDVHIESKHRPEGPSALIGNPSPNRPVDVTYAMGIRGEDGRAAVVLTANTDIICTDAMESMLLEFEGVLRHEAMRVRSIG